MTWGHIWIFSATCVPEEKKSWRLCVYEALAAVKCLRAAKRVGRPATDNNEMKGRFCGTGPCLLKHEGRAVVCWAEACLELSIKYLPMEGILLFCALLRPSMRGSQPSRSMNSYGDAVMVVVMLVNFKKALISWHTAYPWCAHTVRHPSVWVCRQNYVYPGRGSQTVRSQLNGEKKVAAMQRSTPRRPADDMGRCARPQKSGISIHR